MTLRADVVEAANEFVGQDDRGVLLQPGGGPVLATPTALLTVGVFSVTFACPTITTAFGATPTPDGGLIDESEAGLSVGELTERRAAAIRN